mmetsp:Transcript_53063/g.164363  ORF Transcript_53063/g.164363 Transcript_53063/m.164363 type:complete len:96 (-) Transcript_53063:111-398(-)
MDFIATALRSGLTGVRGAYQAARRAALEHVYVVKEFLIGEYDKSVAILTCKRRSQASIRTASFRYESASSMAMRQPQIPAYDFTELQHGVKSHFS